MKKSGAGCNVSYDQPTKKLIMITTMLDNRIILFISRIIEKGGADSNFG